MLQIMADEEGLQGCWFAGAIRQLQHGFALVEYEELMNEDDTSLHLKEWFALPRANAADAEKLGSEYTAHTGSEFQIRPPPPTQVLLLCLHAGVLVSRPCA